MRIRRIEVNNFKSLVDFEIDLAKFTCLIGLNGSGKSTVLQFLDFLARLVHGDLKGWLQERNWSRNDLRSKLTNKKNIDFRAFLLGDSGEEVSWTGSFNPGELRCTSESVSISGFEINVNVKTGSYSLGGPSQPPSPEPIAFSYEGSILSQLREDKIPEAFVRFKKYFEEVKSLDLLSPENLRKRTKEGKGSPGLGGQRLSSFLYELGREKRNSLQEKLAQVYKRLQSIQTKSLRAGWIQLEIQELFDDNEGRKWLSTEARHVNDGLLRLLAIFGELQTDHRFLIFDEIENGINPELVEFVVDALVQAQQQVLVTTHSPMILNYLDDATARDGVVYLYKTAQGHTRAIPFFSIPSLSKKLEVMGPGEAFVDTNLTELQEEIEVSIGVVA